MATVTEPPVDLLHLARYTGGDHRLDTEILQLFITQSRELMAQIPAVLQSGDKKTWHYIAHSLKGAARGIGAFALADMAAKAEPLDPAMQIAEAESAIVDLRTGLEGVQEFIRDFADRNS